MPLTEALVKETKPTNKIIRIYDTKGLYLEINPSGGKYWRLKCRFNGKEKRLALGIYPDVSLNDAKHKRDEIKQQLINDIDPLKEKRLAKEKMEQIKDRELGLRLLLKPNGDLIIKKKLKSILITKEELNSLSSFLLPISKATESQC